jgi:hypothetical protein
MNEDAITITLGDVASMVQLIDVVSQRGAIQGSEMMGVGQLRNKLETFLKENEKTEEGKPEGPLQEKLVK